MSTEANAEAQAPATESTPEETKAVTPTEAKEAPEAAPEVEAEAPAETPAEGEVAETEEEKKTKSRLRRERQQAREQALKDRVADLEERLSVAERNKPQAEGLGDKPDRAKYEDEAEYQADLAAWKVEERILQRQQKAHEANTQNLRSDSAAKKMELFKERAMALKESHPDIEKVFTDTSLPMSPAMAETLMDSEKGPEIAHYLLSHREDAQRIKEMSPLAAARELGRIEARLALPKPRTETKAPPPPSTVSGSVQSPKDPESMNMAEYKRWRENGGGVRRTG